MSSSDGENKPGKKDAAVNRRNILLGGTTLAAVSAIAAGKTIEVAQAQQSSTGSGRQPNILVIMGDDVGWFQYRRLSPRHHVRQNAEPRQARSRGHALY
jgi:hypothetical protein